MAVTMKSNEHRFWEESLQTAGGAANWFSTTEVRVEVSHTMRGLTNI